MHPFPRLGNRCTFSGKSVHFSGKSVHFSGKSVHQTGDNSLNSKELIFSLLILLYYYITRERIFSKKNPLFFFPKVEDRPHYLSGLLRSKNSPRYSSRTGDRLSPL